MYLLFKIFLLLGVEEDSFRYKAWFPRVFLGDLLVNSFTLSAMFIVPGIHYNLNLCYNGKPIRKASSDITLNPVHEW